MKEGRNLGQEPQPRTPANGSLRRPVLLAQAWEELVAQATKTPWMVQSLMVQGRELASRVTTQYLRLRRLPRRARRALARRGALSLASAALLLALAEPEAGWAGTTISVSSGSELSSAITQANSQTGNFTGTNTISLTNSKVIVTSALPAVTSTIVIAGNGNEVVGAGDLSAALFTVASTGNLTLQETTVTGGQGSKGGAFSNYGKLLLYGSTLTGNKALGRGGAIYNSYGYVLLYDSSVSNNSATYGGGVWNQGGGLLMIESVISNNTASNGGGIFTGENSDVWMDDSTVSGNSASGFGGGIAVHGNGAVSAYGGSTVENNHGKYGGGLFIGRQATAIVQNSTISGNTATKNAGGIGVQYGAQISYNIRGGTLTMTYSTISGNTASGQGGGLDIGRFTSVTLENSTISGNSAGDNGGGLNAYPDGTEAYGRSHITISFCTFTGNTAASEGGGLSTGEHTDLTLGDTLVSGNHAPTGRESRNNTTNSDISFDDNNLFGYSGSSGLDGKAHGSSDIVPSVPLSAILDTTLADNGGPTLTNALVSGSPAINAAGSCPPPSLDQRGYGRPASGSTLCDIGAYEFGATESTVPAALGSAQATNTDTGRGNGSVQLAFSAVLPHGLDLSRASAQLRHVLVERGRELVAGLHDPGVELRRLEGAKKDRASFATAAEIQPKVRVQAQVKKGILEVTLRVDQTVLRRPLLCGDDRVTELGSELVLSDGKLPSVRLQLEELWQCQIRKDGRITGLVGGKR